MWTINLKILPVTFSFFVLPVAVRPRGWKTFAWFLSFVRLPFLVPRLHEMFFHLHSCCLLKLSSSAFFKLIIYMVMRDEDEVIMRSESGKLRETWKFFEGARRHETNKMSMNRIFINLATEINNIEGLRPNRKHGDLHTNSKKYFTGCLARLYTRTG